MRITRKALPALAAEYGQASNDVVTRLYVGDISAHCLNDSSGFVSHDGREFGSKQALHEMQVRVA